MPRMKYEEDWASFIKFNVTKFNVRYVIFLGVCSIYGVYRIIERAIYLYNNPHSIAWGINYIINDAKGVRIMGKKGLDLAKKKFSWDNIAKEMIKTYKAI